MFITNFSLQPSGFFVTIKIGQLTISFQRRLCRYLRSVCTFFTVVKITSTTVDCLLYEGKKNKRDVILFGRVITGYKSRIGSTETNIHRRH